jgi:hypothetical protein
MVKLLRLGQSGFKAAFVPKAWIATKSLKGDVVA